MKKALALVLVAMMVFGMTSVAFSATKDVEEFDISQLWSPNDITFGRAGATDWYNDEFEPDEEIKLYINPEALLDGSGQSFFLINDGMILDSNGNPVAKNGGLTTSNLRTQKITVRRSISKGGSVLESVDFDSDSAREFTNNAARRYSYVSVELVEHYVSTGDTDIDYTIYLCLDGKRDTDTAFVISGTISNVEEEVYEDDDYCSGEDGTVIEAEEYVRGIEMYLGDGVSAHLNMFKGTKYYGTATNEVSSADDAVLNQYPSIDTIIVIRQINLSGANVKYTMDMDDTYYVYNADGNYIGTSADELPYSAKYYLSTERITMGSDSSTTESSIGSTGDTGSTGSTAGTPENPGMGGDDL